MPISEKERKRKTDWQKAQWQKPEFREKMRLYSISKREYKRIWVQKKRESVPGFRATEVARTNEWRHVNKKKAGIRKRRKTVLSEVHEETLAGHCQSCGVLVKVKTERLCTTSYCQLK